MNPPWGGAFPYRDYWWPYGPLMPYVFALMMKIFGVTMKSVLWGKFFIMLGIGLFLYLALQIFIPPSFAFLGALSFWTWHKGFYYTYNHDGGLLCAAAMLFFVLKYIKWGRFKDLMGALAAIFVFSLVKLNFGLVNLAVLIIFFFIKEKVSPALEQRQKKVFLMASCILVPGLIFAIYYFLLRGMPSYQIKQCLPFFPSYQPHVGKSWGQMVFGVFPAIARFFILQFHGIVRNQSRLLSAIVVSLFVVHLGINLPRREFLRKERKEIFLALCLLFVLFMANMHEYLLSFVFFRAYWADPYLFTLIFTVIGLSAACFSKRRRLIVFGFLFYFIVARQNYIFERVSLIKSLPEHYFSHPKAKIYIGNNPVWTETVTWATRFLEEQLDEGEQFLALHYDPIYYYLTGRPSPLQELMFVNFVHVPPEQEKRMIRTLEEKQVNWVLISHRSFGPDPALGILGRDYCPLLYQYIQDHFAAVVTFGDYEAETSWSHPHAVRIFRRIK